MHNVRDTLFGIAIPPQWTQNINTAIIVLGGPLMAFVNQHLRARGYKISIPFQFTSALFLIGLGLLLLPIGIHFADFLKLAIASLLVSLILFFLRPFLHKLIQEKPRTYLPYNAQI